MTVKEKRFVRTASRDIIFNNFRLFKNSENVENKLWLDTMVQVANENNFPKKNKWPALILWFFLL